MISIENMKSSNIRSIYPDLTSSRHLPDSPETDEDFLDDSRVDSYSISSSDDERYFFSVDLDDIRTAYLAKDYH